MILRKNGVDLTGVTSVHMETADAAPSKIIPAPEEKESLEMVYEPGLSITITGEKLSKVDNICVYFKEDKT